MKICVRPETGDDVDAIRAVHLAAFPTSQEADLVIAIHYDFDSELSLVAEEARPILGKRIVGHLMLSRMEVTGEGRAYRAVALGPLAVRPRRQRRGIGSALIEEALRQAEARGEELVFVVGEPDYYRRFGFSPDAAAPFNSPYAGPYFMAKSFGVALPASGAASHAAAFGKLR